MTSRIPRLFRRSPGWTLLIIGLILVFSGFALVSVTEAQSGGSPTPVPQSTRFVSIFDQAASSPTSLPPTADKSATVTATATATATSTGASAAEAETATPVPQVTRFTSVFDQPGQGQAQAPATTPEPASTTAPQVTRFASVFDQPQATTPAPGGAAPQATRFTSVFDQAPAAESAGTAGGAQATPYVSIFDTAASDVIRYEGEEPPPAEYCLGCHESPYLQMTLADGEVISVTVDEEEYSASVHGQHGTEGYRCVRCHVGMNEYPHAEVTAKTSRELVIDLSTSCARCHTDMYDETRNDLHVGVLARGNENGATCADCHTAHGVQRLTDEITHQPLPGSAAISAQMCSTCHSEIYARYSESTHGQSVLSGNNDAATCADCHGVHNTQGPSTGPFRLFSPQICANCHADETLMAKYDISTDVFDTYVSDFHGTTVTIFQQTAPDQAFNAPVCVDCHGVHNIASVESADSPVIKENLVSTCQRCHPNATVNFPSAWMSHYPPTFERTPIVAIANLAYTVAIPGVIGALALFVVSDVRRRRSERDKDHK